MASIDLLDAYFQVPIHPSSRKYLHFVHEGKTFQFRALCFGLATAPQVFTRIFSLISEWSHSRGIRFLRYIDDWLVLAESPEELQEAVNSIISLCRELGIVVNRAKSELLPKQRVQYLSLIHI